MSKKRVSLIAHLARQHSQLPPWSWHADRRCECEGAPSNLCWHCHSHFLRKTNDMINLSSKMYGQSGILIGHRVTARCGSPLVRNGPQNRRVGPFTNKHKYRADYLEKCFFDSHLQYTPLVDCRGESCLILVFHHQRIEILHEPNRKSWHDTQFDENDHDLHHSRPVGCSVLLLMIVLGFAANTTRQCAGPFAQWSCCPSCWFMLAHVSFSLGRRYRVTTHRTPPQCTSTLVSRTLWNCMGVRLSACHVPCHLVSS